MEPAEFSATLAAELTVRGVLHTVAEVAACEPVEPFARTA
jgi:hypothetical protein